MADAPVLPDTEDGVAVRTFNRPERLNASAAALSRRFGEGRRELQRSPDVRARVVTGRAARSAPATTCTTCPTSTPRTRT